MKIILISLFLPILALAQEFPFQQEITGIPVTINGWQPFLPWSQGLSYTRPAFGDLDGDGDPDLLVGDYADKLYSYLNAGTGQQAQFQMLQPQLNLGNLSFWVMPAIGDLNGDGDSDILLSDEQGIVRYYENISSGDSIAFTLAGDSLTGTILCGWITLVDIDGDGDLDLFGGSVYGTVQFFRNIGTPQQYNFAFVTNNFAGINVGYDSSPSFCDIDADGDYDLFIGNENGRIWFYRNTGTPQQYQFTYVTNYFDSVDVGDMAAPTFYDIDADGDYDLFLGREPILGSGQTVGDLYFYRNTGTLQNYRFQYVTSNYLSADIGNYAQAQLVDVNGDGRLDLMVSSGTHILFFQNTGTAASPSFTLASTAYGGITLPDITSWFGDLDGDGDMDLVAGTSSIPNPPAVHLYYNQGTPQNPNYVQSPTLITGNFFVLVCPTLADIDGDGDLDLFLTDQSYEGSASIWYYQNNGSAAWPSFQYVTNNWMGIQAGYMQRYQRFYDIDGDGDLDLFFFNRGSEPGGANLRYYQNTGTFQSPQMSLVTATYLPLEVDMAGAAFGDIDSDGHVDMFVGEEFGGTLYFHGTGSSPVNPNPKRPEGPPERMITVLPNSGNSGATISYVLDHPQKISLDVYNLLGAKVASLASSLQLPGNYSYTWDASAKASGIYLLRFTTPDQSISRKITLLK